MDGRCTGFFPLSVCAHVMCRCMKLRRVVSGRKLGTGVALPSGRRRLQLHTAVVMTGRELHASKGEALLFLLSRQMAGLS